MEKKKNYRTLKFPIKKVAAKLKKKSDEKREEKNNDK